MNDSENKIMLIKVNRRTVQQLRKLILSLSAVVNVAENIFKYLVAEMSALSLLRVFVALDHQYSWSVLSLTKARK